MKTSLLTDLPKKLIYSPIGGTGVSLLQTRPLPMPFLHLLLGFKRNGVAFTSIISAVPHIA